MRLQQSNGVTTLFSGMTVITRAFSLVSVIFFSISPRFVGMWDFFVMLVIFQVVLFWIWWRDWWSHTVLRATQDEVHIHRHIFWWDRYEMIPVPQLVAIEVAYGRIRSSLVFVSTTGTRTSVVLGSRSAHTEARDLLCSLLQLNSGPLS